MQARRSPELLVEQLDPPVRLARLLAEVPAGAGVLLDRVLRIVDALEELRDLVGGGKALVLAWLSAAISSWLFARAVLPTWAASPSEVSDCWAPLLKAGRFFASVFRPGAAACRSVSSGVW